MLSFLCLFVLFNAVKTDTKLTLHPDKTFIIMSPTEGEGDILFLVRILLVSALVSVSASASASA